MPLNLKIRNNDGKWLLRQVLYQHVPGNRSSVPRWDSPSLWTPGCGDRCGSGPKASWLRNA
ncbi:hypothetical protein ACP3P8_25680 [Pseudomonas aeruginosa]